MTSPNPRVGCVLVKSSRVLGEGFHRRFGGAHAEAEAIRQAGDDVSGSTAYISLEPCTHHGKTPPCAELLMKSGVSRVVFAVEDPGLETPARGVLEKAGISVTSGVCDEEARELIRDYLKVASGEGPLITLKAASTLDGKTAAFTGKSRWISSRSSRESAMRLRGTHDAILVGAKTVTADNPRLTYRLEDPPAKQPLRVIIDGALSTDPAARAAGEGSLLITSGKMAGTAKAEEFRRLGSKVVAAETFGGVIPAAEILGILQGRGVLSVLVEGGGETVWEFVRQGKIDRVVFFYAPLILGGSGAPTPCGGKGFSSPAEGLNLENLRVSHSGRDILVEADVAALEKREEEECLQV